MTNAVERFLAPERYQPDVPIRPVSWLVRGLWMPARINLLLGAEKAGKSRLLGWLLAAILSDQPSVLHQPIAPERPKRWLYLAGEETKAEVMGRLHDYLRHLGQPNATPDLYVGDAAGLGLESPSRRHDLEALLVRDQYDGLVLEPLRRLHGANEDRNSEMTPILNDLRRWANVLGVTVVLCHHTGKLNEYADPYRIATWSRGASDVATIADTALFLQATSEADIRILTLMRAGRFPPLPPLRIADQGDPKDGGKGFLAL